MPLLKECLKLIRETPEYESWLVMTDSAKLTLSLETEDSLENIEALADYVLRPEEIGAGPASGSFRTEGMLVVPCSMKTAAGIRSGYTDNLLLRAADVTIKEQPDAGAGGQRSPSERHPSEKSLRAGHASQCADHSADDILLSAAGIAGRSGSSDRMQAGGTIWN